MKEKTEKPKTEISCPFCRQQSWIEFDNGFYRSEREFNNNKQRHQIEKKLIGHDKNFSTKSPFADEIQEIYFPMMKV